MGNKAPEIFIDNEKYVLPRPKVKTWRSILRFDEAIEDVLIVDMYDAYAQELAEIFDDKKLTKEMILENVAPAAIVNTYSECFKFVYSVINESMEKMPKIVQKAKA